jgi:serine protease
MSFRALCVLAALMVSCLSPAGAAKPQPRLTGSQAEDTGEARVIVRFRAEAGTVRTHALSATDDRSTAKAALQRRADALAARHGVVLTAGRGITERSQVVRAQGMDSATLARRLAADPEIESVVVDHRRRALAVPNDPLFLPAAGSSPASGQWYLKTPDSVTPASIDAVSAWDTTQGKRNMVVAVLDTGVRYDHPDLDGKLLTGRDMVSNATVANDGDGRDADASDPGDWVTTAEVNDSNSPFYHCNTANSDGSYTADPSSWHGTIVSGIIGAATDNGVGMAGVGWNTKILPVRVLGKCFGYDSDIQAGMLWAAGVPVPGEPANPVPARVLNMSLGGDGACDSFYTTTVNHVLATGAVIVAAAGNGNGHAVGAPGNCPGVIAVAGLRQVGTKVGYSDLGPEVTIAAPAGNCVTATGACLYPILSTTNKGTNQPIAGAGGAGYTDAFNISVGTSFSSPLVAGTVALMLSANPALTNTQVKNLLKSSARAFPTSGGSAGIGVCQAPSSTDQNECYCTTSTCGAGMLDSGAAVRAAAQLAAAPTGVQASILVSPASPSVGDTVTLTASIDSGGPPSTSVWSVVSGAANITPSADGSSATLTASAAGDVVVRLTLTDGANVTTRVDQPFRVAAAASTTPPTGTNGNTDTGGSGTSSGGGGGGAMSWPWLAALAGAVLLLAAARRRARG